jgi:hypothetical protein
MLDEYQAVSDWVRRLFSTYADQVVVHVIDAASVEGVWKTARYRLWRYPAVVIAGRSRFEGTDFSAAESEIARCLGVAPPVSTRDTD